ncbi:MAG: hypothetical protein NTW49_00620 [Bacteroidia bacterium]|nr:hypothetical protein [Bacteroidia bacterium]
MNAGQQNFEKYFSGHENNNYFQYQNNHTSKFLPDTTIGKISLCNKNNIDSYLGSDIMDRLTEVGQFDEGLPHATFLSKDKKQRLMVIFHPGGYIKEFSEFQVAYNKKSDTVEKIIEDKVFMTESDIKLGISITQLKILKGKPDSISYDKSTTLFYQINDFDNSKFLQKYDYPGYYARYKFINNKLVYFKFGFEYP